MVSSITNINNSIRYLSFVGTQLNVFMYLTLIILFDINHLFAQSLNSFKYCYFTLGYSDGDIIIIIIGFLGLVGFALVMLVLHWLRWYFVGSVGITLVVIPSLNVDGK